MDVQRNPNNDSPVGWLCRLAGDFLLVLTALGLLNMYDDISTFAQWLRDSTVALIAKVRHLRNLEKMKYRAGRPVIR